MSITYEQSSLNNILNSIIDLDTTVENYLNSYDLKDIIIQKKELDNTNIDNNIFKSLIIEELNKLNSLNLMEIVSKIKSIKITKYEELEELITQIISKICRDVDKNKLIVGLLCFELQNTIYNLNEKYIFKNILLQKIKKEYLIIMDFDNIDYSFEYNKKISNVIYILYQSNIINNDILIEIFNDYVKIFTICDDIVKTEKCIIQFCHFINYFKMTEELLLISNNIDVIMKTQLDIFNKNKIISKKVRITMETTIEKLFV